MRASIDALAAAAADIEEAEDALHQAVRVAHACLGTDEEERTVRVVEKCKRERDRANQRFLELQRSGGAVLTT